MSRIPTPASIADAPEKARPLLEGVNRQFGVVPNIPTRRVSKSSSTSR